MINLLIDFLLGVLLFFIIIFLISLQHYFYYFLILFYIKKWKHIDKDSHVYIITDEKNTLIFDKKKEEFYLFCNKFKNTSLTTLSNDFITKISIIPYFLFKYYISLIKLKK